MRLNGHLIATASLCLWPWLSECGSIDEVLLNIKMRAQIKGIIAEADRSRPELVEDDMVGQANNMFWLLVNELRMGMKAWIWVRCMAGGVGGMREFYPGMCKSTLYSS